MKVKSFKEVLKVFLSFPIIIIANDVCENKLDYYIYLILISLTLLSLLLSMLSVLHVKPSTEILISEDL